MNIYRMIVHHKNKPTAMTWTRANRRIAIGWGSIGDVTKYQTKADVKAALRKHYPPPIRNNSASGSESLWSFCHDVQRGDLIISSGDRARELVVEIAGDYEFVPGASPLLDEYNHQRAIEITDYDGDKLWRAAGGLKEGVSRYQALVCCERKLDEDALENVPHPH